ncbi:MAG: bifunctional diguanylate cyclase/phosphodiesterase, partial [Methylococcales bacterium]
LLIISDDLPGCQLNILSQALCNADAEIFIPLLIIKKCLKCEWISQNLDSRCLIYHLNQDYNPLELQMVAEFLIKLKIEQQLRQKQQKRLINELAERKIVDAKLKYLVTHDELTGLLNRTYLEQKIRLTLNRNNNRKFKQDSFLLFIDLDRFSLINELEGFNVGDRLLVEAITIIRKVLLNVGLFARIGSDEFCLYLEHSCIEDAKLWAETIRKALDEFRFLCGETAYSITASIGIGSLDSVPAILHPHELISLARQACCMAKTNGRNMVWEFNNEDYIVKERHRDLFWVPIIRDALLNNAFYLVFQPVVNLIDGDVSHYEVLIRLRGISGLEINPSEFIQTGERMGLIHGIDVWVVEKAIDFLADLPMELAHISLAINLSGVAFQDDALLPVLKQKLDMTWVNAERITFEITETAAVDNFEKTRTMINQIRALGCHFALDDFGAGFCSFNYLKKFPVDYVKIDGQFIQNLTHNETDRLLVKAMHQIAKKLGKKTIAEFVENAETMLALREIGINFGQGHFFGKPSTKLLAHNVFQFDKVTTPAEKPVNKV